MKTNSLTNKRSLFKIKIGDILDLKVSALGNLNKSKKEMGLAELPNGLTIVLPNTNLGDLVKAKITKINEPSSSLIKKSINQSQRMQKTLVGHPQKHSTSQSMSSTVTNYAVGEVLEIIKQSFKEPVVNVGEILNVTINGMGPRGAGLINLPNNYKIVVPNSTMGQTLKIKITRVKLNYAFAKVINLKNSFTNEYDKISTSSNSTRAEDKEIYNFNNNASKGNNTSILKITEPGTSHNMTNSSVHTSLLNDTYTGRSSGILTHIRSELNIILPKTANQYANHVAIKINGLVFFVKMGLGAQLGDKVRLKITKVESNFAMAKIVKVSPLSPRRKSFKIQKTFKKMLASGLHFGEKSMKCHANMRKFVWLNKKGKQKNRPLIQRGRHLINLLKTRRCLIKALQQLSKYAAKGRTFLFIGTKKPAAGLIARAAMLTKTSFFVNTRWLGGMLTNWKTILKSISKIRPILKEKQKIIKNILEKRQQIKTLLIKKVNKLRNKSKQLIFKGKSLISKVKKEKKQLLEKSQQLLKKRKQYIGRGNILINKSQQILDKTKQINEKIAQVHEKINNLITKKKNLIHQLEISQIVLKEQKLLLIIAQELRKLKKLTKQQGKTVWTLSFGKMTKLINQEINESSKTWMVPNPPKEILNKIISNMKEKYDSSFTISSLNNNNLQLNRPKIEENASTVAPVYLLSKLINKYSSMLPLLKTQIKALKVRIQNIKKILINIQEILNTKLKNNLKEQITLKKKLISEIIFIKMKLNSEQQIINNLKIKITKLSSEQRLLKFLPKLRYLPTPKNQISETIQILMKKFVDPKMRYPIDQIYDEKLKSQSKKIAAARKQKWQRLEKYFGGVMKMAKLKNRQISKNVAIVVGQQEEMNAVRECQKLGIKMFNIVDTNCNPRFADHFVPANDDSRNSIKFILGQILMRIRLAQKIRKKILSPSNRRLSSTYVTTLQKNQKLKK